jgi:hypothetical protein
MIKISHRGNINGPVLDKENRPSYIDAAIQLGYEVEVDIRFINDEFWLGHDEPQYKVVVTWIKLRKDKLWIHCKDTESASELLKLDNGYKIFCHTNDPYVLTTTNHLWVHDLTTRVDSTSIIPLIGLEDIKNYKGNTPFAVCSDYVSKIKTL